MFAVDVDLAVEFRELSVSRPEKLVHRESDLRLRLIELVSLISNRDRTGSDNHECSGSDDSNLHAISFVLPFVSDASVFKSGVRESGNFPKRLPSANAGLRAAPAVTDFAEDFANTPVI